MITDRLPEDAAFVSASDGGTYDADTHTVQWSMETGAHEEGAVSVEVKILDSATGKTVENQAYVDMDEAHIGTEAENGEKKDEHTRNYVPAKYVLDADGRDINGENVAAGDIVTYKITYKNDSYTVRTVEVNDILPAGVSFVDASNDGRVYSVVKGDNVRWCFDVEPDTEGFVTVRVKAGAELSGEAFANSAAVTVSDRETGQAKTAGTNQVVNYVLEELLKSVKSENGKKDLNGETVGSGMKLQYQITVKNTAVEERTFQVTDEVPEGCSFVSAGNGGSCENGVVAWTVTLAGGQSQTVTFLVQVLKEAEGGSVQNVASVSGNDVTLTSNRVRTYVEKPDTLLDDIKELVDGLPGNSGGSVTVNVDNSNKNEAAGGNASGENASGKDSSKKDSSGGGSEKAGAAGKTSQKAGQSSRSANVPKTGDDSNIGLWAVIAAFALLAGGASAGYAIYKARKKDGEDA